MATNSNTVHINSYGSIWEMNTAQYKRLLNDVIAENFNGDPAGYGAKMITPQAITLTDISAEEATDLLQDLRNGVR